MFQRLRLSLQKEQSLHIKEVHLECGAPLRVKKGPLGECSVPFRADLFEQTQQPPQLCFETRSVTSGSKASLSRPRLASLSKLSLCFLRLNTGGQIYYPAPEHEEIKRQCHKSVIQQRLHDSDSARNEM